MTSAMYSAVAASKSRETEGQDRSVFYHDSQQASEEKLGSSPGRYSEHSGDADNEDGKEKKLKNKLLGSIRDFFNAPNVKISHGKTIIDIPSKRIREIRGEDINAFEAPEGALAMIHNQRLKKTSNERVDKTPVAGITNWKRRGEDCYGIVTSLYDKKKDSSVTVGDPVADCLTVLARPNNSILILADGVSWGDRSRLAARAAVYGSLTYLTKKGTLTSATTTRDVFRSILRSFENAQNIITEEEGTLTTLCVGVVVELERDKWGFCVVNVGDSLAFAYNETAGVREVTMGSHSIKQERDMRCSGGALGPADGYNPDLSNLTCSFTQLETGDVVYLTSDGISDNFDPAVGKFHIASPGLNAKEADIGKKALTPKERHNGMLIKMRQIIEEEEGPTGVDITAIGVCAKFMNFVLNNTQSRRRLLEESSLSEIELSNLTSKERKERAQDIKGKLESTPGKLDHASIVACRVGYLQPAPLQEMSRNWLGSWEHVEAEKYQSEDETLTSSESQELQNDEDEDEQAQSAIFEVLLKETTL